MRQLAIVLGVAAVFGCDNSRSVNVSNKNALGTVGGQVLDLNGEAPLANATVTLTGAGGPFMATTDATGSYSIPNVPVGTFFVTASMMGYESAYFPGQLTGTVGNFPVSNPIATMPTVELFKTEGSFSVAVVDDRGAPVMGVPLTARPQVRFYWYDLFGFFGGSTPAPILQPYGQYSVNATTDAMGGATFMGLPSNLAFNMLNQGGTELLVDVAPITVMGTKTYQFAGATFPFNPTRFTGTGTNVATIQLAGPSTGLSVLNSNIDFNGPSANHTYQEIAASSTISITFNQAVDQSKVRAQLLDDTGNNLGNLTPTFVAGNIVTLAPPGTGLVAGKRYTLVFHAVPLSGSSGSGSTSLDQLVPIFVQGPATTTVTAALTNVTAPPFPPPFNGVGHWVLLTFSDAVGIASAVPIPCTAWYDGIDLDADGGGMNLYQGEFASPLPMCPSTVAPIGNIDMTKITIYEPSPITTGYSNKWYIQIDDGTATGGCKTGAATCTKPASGTMLHLVFSRALTTTFRRPNGTPVPDLTVAIQ